MGRVEFTGLVLVCIGIALYAMRPEPSLELQAAKQPQPVVVQPATQAPIQAPVRQTLQPRSMADKLTYVPPKSKSKQIVVDARYAQMNGLIGESSQWVSSVFDNPYWTAIKPNQFSHTNGSHLRLSFAEGRVRKIRVDFTPNLASPAMQTVLDYVLGRATNAPFYLDTLADSTDVLTGTFEHKGKHQLRYTAGVSKTDESAAWITIEVVD